MRRTSTLMTLLLICCVSAANAHELKTSITENNKTKELTSTEMTSSAPTSTTTSAMTEAALQEENSSPTSSSDSWPLPYMPTER